MIELSLAEARRMALAAQGFAQRRPAGRVTLRHLRALIQRLNLIQLDSVNVLVRAHYMPAFSRLGPYDRDALDSLAYEKREMFEYWGHEASLIEMSLFPLFRWVMERAQGGHVMWRSVRQIAEERPGYIEEVYRLVEARGPFGISGLDAGARTEKWWGWNAGKATLEYLFWTGRITAHTRRNFERIYDITSRVIPPQVYDAPVPDETDAKKQLLRLSARALGVATASDLADYFRLKKPMARALIHELAEDGELLRGRVEGWKDPVFIHPSAKAPRAIGARALLSPFDPLVWERSRAERLFGMRYRIEIYVPAHKRVHGYYVLPFLLGETLVARADLKADRANSTLIVHAAYAEPGAPPQAASEFAKELRSMADWLGLERVKVGARGDLARPLKRALPKS